VSTPLDPLRLPLHGSRLIEASAGTGKTWTIATLYLRLVLGHGTPGGTAFAHALQPAQILVMTFTRAATRELAERIRQRLVQALACFRGEAEVPADDSFLHDLRAAFPAGPQRARAAWQLAQAAENMDEAAIHTMDAWCQRMLHEHALDAASLFDETLQADESRCQLEATQDYWRQNCYPLRGALLQAALRVWPGAQHLIADMRALLHHPDSADAFAAAPAQTLAQCLQRTQNRLGTLANGWMDKARCMREWLENQLGNTNNSALWNRQKLQPRYYNPWFEAIVAWAQQPHAVALDLPPAARQRLSRNGLREAFKGDESQFAQCGVPCGFDELPTLLAQLAHQPSPSAAARHHAAATISARMAQLKRQHGHFGYADMPRRLDAALHGAGGAALRARILAQYPVALIDEFQDTSRLQYRLFDAIYRSAENPAHSALLLIGDPKQSIYRFRGADIYSYLQVRRATAGRHYVLDTNHRSSAALVQAINHWFNHAEQRADSSAFLLHAENSADENLLPFVAVRAKGRAEILCAQDSGQDGPE